MWASCLALPPTQETAQVSSSSPHAQVTEGQGAIAKPYLSMVGAPGRSEGLQDTRPPYYDCLEPHFCQVLKSYSDVLQVGKGIRWSPAGLGVQ